MNYRSYEHIGGMEWEDYSEEYKAKKIIWHEEALCERWGKTKRVVLKNYPTGIRLLLDNQFEQDVHNEERIYSSIAEAEEEIRTRRPDLLSSLIIEEERVYPHIPVTEAEIRARRSDLIKEG